ncbi:unnamed protein product [Cunninghamella blakesleeana]
MSSTHNVLKPSSSPTTIKHDNKIVHVKSVDQKKSNPTYMILHSTPTTTTTSTSTSTSLLSSSITSNTLLPSIHNTNLSSTSIINNHQNDPLISSLPEQQKQQDNNNDNNNSISTPLIGGMIGGILFLILSIFLIICCFRKQKKRKREINPSMEVIKEHGYHRQYNNNNNKTKSWASIGSTTSSQQKNGMIDPPPPAYHSLVVDSNFNTLSNASMTSIAKKRLTQDSTLSKPSSVVKQYHPQLAYSPSDHSILQMDHHTNHHGGGNISPSNTLVDTSNSWLYQKEDDDENLHVGNDVVSHQNKDLQQRDIDNDEDDEEQQQRRSIQPYQAQLDYSSPISDALIPPGPYDVDTLLHTNQSNST